MNVVPIPSSLEKRVAAPHKTTSHRDVGTLSFLEKSFFELRIGEMEYWIASGVVKEAMDGHSRSKRPYKTSLLNFLSLSLADYQWPTSENFHRLNAILDYLWNNGAQEAKEMHEIWLSRLAPYDLADTLLNAGAHPGRDPLKTHPNTKLRNSNWVSALEQSLRLIYTHERANVLRKTPIDFPLIHAWTSRVKRFLTVGGHDDGVMARALGILYQLASFNPGNSEWSEMRDTLLKQGATASVHNNGVLSGIFHNAPTNPVTSTNIYYIMKEWREKNGHSDVVFSDDILNDILEKELNRRNQAWTDCTTSWIEALSTITGPDGQTALSRRTPISTQTTQEEFERVLLNGTDDVHLWKALLDAPNGTVIATQLSRGLSQGKKTLPWTHASDDKWWHRRDENAKILTTINQRLSARRLYALVKIINDPIVSQNVDPQWCNTLATNMLPFESLGDNRQDPAPSEIYCHEKPSGMMNPVNLSWIPKRLPSTEELHGLLQLAPPALRQTVEQTYWLDNLLPQITTLWDKNNTDEATRFSYLRLLHSYGALLDKEKKAISLVEFEGSFDTLYQSVKELRNSFYGNLRAYRPEQQLVADLISEKNPIAGQGLRRMFVVDWMENGKADECEQPPPKWVLDIVESDPGVLTFAGNHLNTALSMASDWRANHARKIGFLHKLQQLGWQPENHLNIAQQLLYKLVSPENVPDAQEQKLLFATMQKLLPEDGMKKQAAFVKELCERWIRTNTPADTPHPWSTYCLLVLEHGGEPLLAKDLLDTPLGRLVASFERKKSLHALLGEIEPTHPPKNKPRF